MNTIRIFDDLTVGIAKDAEGHSWVDLRTAVRTGLVSQSCNMWLTHAEALSLAAALTTAATHLKDSTS